MTTPIIDNRIKFRHLQCFIEVVRQGGVVKAADHLSLTQPAVSKKLKELEQMLGIDLIDRQKKGVVLTRFGEIFLRYAVNSADSLRQGIERVHLSSSAEHAPIVIGVLPTIASMVMPSAVRRFKEAMPEADVSIITATNTQLLGALRVSELDLVVGRLGEPDQMQGLVFEQLYLERIAIVVRSGHPILHQGGDSRAAISDYPLMMPNRDSIIRGIVDHFLILNGITPNANVIETISHSFGRSYIRDTDAVWLVSHGAVARDIQEGVFAELPFNWRETVGPVGFTSRVDSIGSEGLSLLVSNIRDVCKNISDY